MKGGALRDVRLCELGVTSLTHAFFLLRHLIGTVNYILCGRYTSRPRLVR